MTVFETKIKQAKETENKTLQKGYEICAYLLNNYFPEWFIYHKKLEKLHEELTGDTVAGLGVVLALSELIKAKIPNEEEETALEAVAEDVFTEEFFKELADKSLLVAMVPEYRELNIKDEIKKANTKLFNPGQLYKQERAIANILYFVRVPFLSGVLFEINTDTAPNIVRRVSKNIFEEIPQEYRLVGELLPMVMSNIDNYPIAYRVFQEMKQGNLFALGGEYNAFYGSGLHTLFVYFTDSKTNPDDRPKAIGTDAPLNELNKLAITGYTDTPTFVVNFEVMNPIDKKNYTVSALVEEHPSSEDYFIIPLYLGQSLTNQEKLLNTVYECLKNQQEG